jgi:hypothetical protein
MNVAVSPKGLEMGWENGDITRWIALKKVGDTWMVWEFANNP